MEAEAPAKGALKSTSYLVDELELGLNSEVGSSCAKNPAAETCIADSPQRELEEPTSSSDSGNDDDPKSQESLMADKASDNTYDGSYDVSHLWYAKIWNKYKKLLKPKAGDRVFKMKPWQVKPFNRFPLWRVQPHWLALYCFLGLVIWFTTVALHRFAADTGNGEPQFLSCDATWWSGDINCGVAGVNCRPFSGDTLNIRCESYCNLKDDTRWYVYGSKYYRADSRICKAAIHSGFITAEWGGCVKVVSTGPQFSFPGSFNNGILTKSYDYWFPKSYTFEACDSPHFCTDIRFIVLLIVLLLFLGFLFFDPPPRLFFFTLCILGFWHVALVSQYVPSLNFVSNSIAAMTTFTAVCLVLYNYIAKYTLPKSIGKFPFESYVFYVLPCFLMIHMNYFEYFLPPITLTGGSKKESNVSTYNPGVPDYPEGLSIFFTIVLFLLIIILAGIQLRTIWLSGRMYKVIAGYVVFFGIFLFFFLLTKDKFYVHIHHYLLALLLFPITMYNNRMSLLSQGALLGMFINGAARWGFASIFENARSSATSPPLPPDYLNITNVTSHAISLVWPAVTNETEAVYSLVLNNLEVYRGLLTEYTIDFLSPNVTYLMCVRSVLSGNTGYCSDSVNATTPLS